MTKSASEIFNTVFEEIIVPMMDKIMQKDYEKIIIGENDLCENEIEFIKFRGAFEQRLKLFYFREFTKYKKEGREKMFPDNVNKLEEDINFLYVGFQSFLKEQRTQIGKE